MNTPQRPRAVVRQIHQIRPTILVVAEDFSTRIGIRASLENTFAILESEHLEDAVEMYDKARPAGIIFDMGQDEQLAITLAEHLRHTPPPLPVVLVISDVSDAACSQRLLNLGILAYYLKPIIPVHLLIELKNHLWSKQAVQHQLRPITSRLPFAQ